MIILPYDTFWTDHTEDDRMDLDKFHVLADSEAGMLKKEMCKVYFDIIKCVKRVPALRPSSEDVSNMYSLIISTVKPLNSRHTGGRTLVHCRGVIPISKVDWLATPPI